MMMVPRLAKATGIVTVAGLLVAGPAQAAPIVAATVTPAGELFHYDYSITFDPLDDEIVLLDLNVLPSDLNLNATVAAPAGYSASYDMVLGILHLSPDFFFPLAGTLSGFVFESAYAPAQTTFSALTINGATLTGSTSGPLGPATTVPEPGTGVLLTIGLLAIRRRGSRTTRHQARR